MSKSCRSKSASFCGVEWQSVMTRHSDTRCIHHSACPLRHSDLHDGDQRNATDYGAKPAGLWFSVGDGLDWQALVTARYSPEEIRFQTEVVFFNLTDFLQIGNAAALDAFTTEYGLTRHDGKQAIDWARVARNFSGIIIAPHCEERANYNQTRWYSCWEVSCGCVWAVRAVKTLRPLNYTEL
jgi:hypothetical protein